MPENAYMKEETETLAVEGKIEISQWQSQRETLRAIPLWHFTPTLPVETRGNKPHPPSERRSRVCPGRQLKLK